MTPPSQLLFVEIKTLFPAGWSCDTHTHRCVLSCLIVTLARKETKKWKEFNHQGPPCHVSVPR